MPWQWSDAGWSDSGATDGPARGRTLPAWEEARVHASPAPFLTVDCAAVFLLFLFANATPGPVRTSKAD